jgi:lincosamide nucleotidyltransferase A/C/D/E
MHVWRIAGARGTMDADSVLEVLDILEAASVRVWLDGGWGVDALLGEQTRSHADLDLILSADDAPNLRATLSAVGFQARPGGSDTNFVVTDDRGRTVDVHVVKFDSRGYGSFELPDGRRWPFPAAAFAGAGRIGDRVVRCLSVDAQVQCHGQGYEPTENDLRDMERLQQRFGVVLPLALCRQLNGR